MKYDLNLLLRATVAMVTKTKDRKMANLSNFKAIWKVIPVNLSYEI